MHKPNARKIFMVLNGIIFTLLLLNIASFFHVYFNGLDQDDPFFKLTNFNTEKNLPSVFSGFLHFFASIFLAVVGFSAISIKTSQVFWFTMSFIFLFLGLDEILRIHETISGHTAMGHQNNNPFLYTWIIYYGSALILMGAFFFKPLFQLPRKTLLNFILAGFIFILGAIGLENVAGQYIWTHQIDPEMVNVTPEIFVLYSIEEFLEMFGVSFFILSILKFLDLHRTPVTT